MYLNLLVQPRSSKTEIVGVHDGRLKVKLKSPPVDGQANETLVKFLARLTKLPRSAISITKGARSKRKRLKLVTDDVDGVTKTIRLYV